MRNNQIENSAKNTEILDTSSSIEPSINYDSILDNFELPICIVCGREVITYWEPLYSGMRASCKNCEINWAES